MGTTLEFLHKRPRYLRSFMPFPIHYAQELGRVTKNMVFAQGVLLEIPAVQPATKTFVKSPGARLAHCMTDAKTNVPVGIDAVAVDGASR